jgi:hypothetical protein
MLFLGLISSLETLLLGVLEIVTGWEKDVSGYFPKCCSDTHADFLDYVSLRHYLGRSLDTLNQEEVAEPE